MSQTATKDLTALFAGFEPASIDEYMINPHGVSYTEE